MIIAIVLKYMKLKYFHVIKFTFSIFSNDFPCVFIGLLNLPRTCIWN